eukprot:gene8031-biopygen22587
MCLVGHMAIQCALWDTYSAPKWMSTAPHVPCVQCLVARSAARVCGAALHCLLIFPQSGACGAAILSYAGVTPWAAAWIAEKHRRHRPGNQGKMECNFLYKLATVVSPRRLWHAAGRVQNDATAQGDETSCCRMFPFTATRSRSNCKLGQGVVLMLNSRSVRRAGAGQRPTDGDPARRCSGAAARALPDPFLTGKYEIGASLGSSEGGRVFLWDSQGESGQSLPLQLVRRVGAVGSWVWSIWLTSNWHMFPGDSKARQQTEPPGAPADLGQTAEDASGTRPFLQILSSGARQGRVRSRFSLGAERRASHTRAPVGRNGTARVRSASVSLRGRPRPARARCRFPLCPSPVGGRGARRDVGFTLFSNCCAGACTI